VKLGEWVAARMGRRILGYWFMRDDGRVFYQTGTAYIRITDANGNYAESRIYVFAV
jgi:hypothetical protein